MSKMMIFETNQKNLAIIGIGPELGTQPYPFNGKILMGLLILTYSLISINLYAFNYAETFFEYTQCIFMTCVATLITSALLILALKVEKMFEFINLCDTIVNTCEKN